MSVTTIGRVKYGTHVRGRLFTPTQAKRRTSKRQMVGRATAILMACGAGFIATVLAPTYALPIAFMAFFALIGGFIMDETANEKHLWLRLIGPVLALAGLGLVVYLLVSGGM
jgi:hypothetical protein